MRNIVACLSISLLLFSKISQAQNDKLELLPSEKLLIDYLNEGYSVVSAIGSEIYLQKSKILVRCQIKESKVEQGYYTKECFESKR